MKRVIWSRFLRQWFTSPRAAGARKAKKQSARALIRPRLENLEDRTLPAPVFTVNAPGDAGVGAGTSGDIRYCINQADITSNAGATIVFNTAAIGGSIITLTHGELEISNTMTLEGPGAGNLTISGDADGSTPTSGTTASRVFNIIAPQATVTISGLTISGGNGSPSTSVTPGNQGGDIFNGGNLTLQNDVVQNGFVLGVVGGPAARGGGIFNAEGQNGSSGATLTLDATLVQNNEARGADGKDALIYISTNGGDGGFGAGGGIYNDSNATVNLVNGSQIINNTALGGKGGNGFHGLNGSNNSAGTGFSGGKGGSGGSGGAGLGGGLFNNTDGTLSITGTNTTSILITDNVAQGGNGGNGDFGGNGGNGGKLGVGGRGGAGGNGGVGGSTLGGGLYSSGKILSLDYAQLAGNQSIGGNGGNGNFGGNAGNGGSKGAGGVGGAAGQGGAGGSAGGGAIYSAGSAFTIVNTQFTTDAAGVGSQAIGGNGGNASNGGLGGNGGATYRTITNGVVTTFPVGGGPAGIGGPGGAGGNALGGAVFNAGGGVSFTNVTIATTVAKAGSGGAGGVGAAGGVGGDHLAGGTAGLGGPGGAGGVAQGGGVYSSGGSLTFLNSASSNSQVTGGNGGVGGNAGVGGVGGVGGGGHKTTASSSAPGGAGQMGGGGGRGGAGGAAQGGGFYNSGGALTITNSQFTNDSVASGSGNTGGNGGNGGVGGIAGKKFFLSGAGGKGGPGGAGGDAGYADGGGGTNAGGNVTITGTTFTNDVVKAGNGGTGGIGGNGGEGGDANANVLGASGSGGGGGNGGPGGSGSTAQGGGLSVSGGTLTLTGSTFGGSSALADQVLGGNGGVGGNGGLINISGAPGHGYLLFPPQTPNGGNGGEGGAGTIVSGGGLAVSKSPPPVNLKVLNSFQGLAALVSGEFDPPDTQGGAGKSEYVETVNQAVGIYSKTTGKLITNGIDSLNDFFFTQGGLAHLPNDSQGDNFTTYDPLVDRFVVGDLEIGFDPKTGQEENALLLAVSKSGNPASLTSSDWYFYEIPTTETGVSLQDYPGDIGFNADALVITQNSFDASGFNIAHTLINTISISALTSGATLSLNQNYFQTDYTGTNDASLRPVTMTDSKPGDPMWFVQSAGQGGSAINPLGATSINVIKMTNVLSGAASFTVTPLTVNRYFQAVPPLQPDGSFITFQTDSRILNADESNGQIVAAQIVSDPSGDEDNSRWYQIDVSSGTPKLVQEGDVGGGAGVYDMYPGIAINSSGSIGLSYIQSGTASGQFMSVYITGRLASDTLGTMEASHLIQAGIGTANYNGFREGDMSAINVDPTDQSFWIANEFADTEQPLNWGTAIGHFKVVSSPPPVRTVNVSDSSFDDNVLVGGNGNIGGKGGLLPSIYFPPQTVQMPVGGNNGIGGDGGNAIGGGVSLSNDAAQTASLLGVDVSANLSTGGLGGSGQFQDRISAGAGGFKGGSNSSNGGAGGSVIGGGISNVNFSLTVGSSPKSASKIKGNVGTAGTGGVGGSYSLQAPDTSYGGDGGAGGSAKGGGIAFENELSGTQTTLSFTVNGATISNNQMTAAAGGAGGGAGTWGHDHILGGAGGAGGQALGGGLYVFSGNSSVNNTSISGVTLQNNSLAAGNGANAGAGASATSGTAAGQFASGGDGGEAQGGGLYNNTLNSTTLGTLSIGYSTMAGNQLTAGSGGLGATGTTANGGPGGNGGNGGNAEGGGFFDGNSLTLTVVNTTIGGSPLSSQSATANSNTLIAGSGGAGNNAGTPAGLSRAQGGNGGNAGNADGGGAFVNSGTTYFINDTILNNLAGNPLALTQAGAPGSGAGAGGAAGTAGKASTNSGGGYFAVSGVNNVGNSILDLNNIVTLTNSAPTVTAQDATGTFVTLGNNILGSTTGATGFNTKSPGTDKIATASQLNIGPLLDNGGPSPTDALLNNANGKSIAIDAGGNTLVTASGNAWFNMFGGTPTDQRGTGFNRIVNGTVDIGAFELAKPNITGLSASATAEGSKNVTLTISGTGFQSGATVNYGGTILTPTSISGSQILVNIAGPLPGDETPPIPVSVGNPDGSGIPGETLNSNTVNFTITEGTTFSLVNPGNQNGDVNDNVSLTIAPAPPDNLPNAGVGNFTDVVNGQHTLPPGLSINSNTGVISGTIDVSAAPSSSKTYKVTLTAYDGPTANKNTATVSFNWVVNPFALAQIPNQTNNEGDQVSLTILSSTGSVASNYSAKGLPTGLSIEAKTGVISGTIDPRGAGNYKVTVTAGSGDATANTTFNWTVNDTTAPALTNPGNQSNNIGDSPNLQIQAQDADSYSATGLPSGLTISSSTGLISGTITGNATTTYSVTVTATDSGVTSTTSFIWKVTIPFGLLNPEPVNSSGTQVPLQNNESDTVSLQMAPVAGYTASNYSASGLPTGLTINPTTGLISGTIDPRGAGNYTVKVQANDSQGQLASVTFSWIVDDTTPPVLTYPGLQTSTAGQTISHFAILADDADPGTYVATGLPQGLSIDANGVISGTIASNAVGNYTVTIQASDSSVASSPMSFLWSVSAAPPASPSSPAGSPPPSSPPGIPPGVAGLTTSLNIVSVQNSYPGLVQLETVTADVTNINGYVVNGGIVTFQVNGQTLFAPVVNGVATVTFSTGLLDLNDLNDYLFSHPLTASYSDSKGIFAPSGSGLSVPAIWIDYFMSLLTSQLRELTQLQTP